MSYGFKKGSGKSLPIEITKENAIAKGRYVSNIEYRKTDSGVEFLSISVTDKDGRTAKRSYFPPKLGVGFINSQEIFAREEGKLNRVLENVTKVFLGNSYETGPVSSFEEFCKKVITDIGKSYSNKELRIKLVYDSKNRSSLPGYAPIFEDPAVISDDATALKINVRDRVEKIEVAMDKDDGLEISKPKAEDEDDLPFK